jgi:hypothetical protein
MQISWERVATLAVSVGIWAVLLLGGRHFAHVLRSAPHLVAHLMAGRRGRLV